MSKQMKTPTSHISEGVPGPIPAACPLLACTGAALPDPSADGVPEAPDEYSAKTRRLQVFSSWRPLPSAPGCVTEESNEKPARWEAEDQAPQHTCFFGMLGPKQSYGFQRSAAANPHSSENLPPSVAKQGVNQADAVVVCQSTTFSEFNGFPIFITILRGSVCTGQLRSTCVASRLAIQKLGICRSGRKRPLL